MSTPDDRPAERDPGRRIVLGVTVGLSLGFLSTVSRELTDRGWDVHVVCSPVGPGTAPVGGATLHEVPMARSISPGADLRALSGWSRLLRELDPDVVVGATPKAALLAMLAARRRRVPVRIFHVWGARWDGMEGRTAAVLRAADRVAAGCATDVVAVSDSLADLFLAQRVTSARPVVLGSGGWPGVDTEQFRPSAEAPTAPDGGAGPVIGYVGRLSVDKGIEDLLDAHSRCREVWPDARLDVIGQVDEAQPIDPGVISRLRGPGVRWVEWVPRVEDELRTWDVLLFPSRREGMPNVVLEAAACGLPVVGYRTTGVKDAVEDGVTGRLVPLGDREALAGALIELLSRDRAAMRRAARESAVARFSRPTVVGRFVDFAIERATRGASHEGRRRGTRGS